jgi:two-component system, cell cycle sensor histidine kinase and response regulator CckA
LPLRPTRVMVVDDEPFVRSLSRRMLEDAGYQVYEAGDGVDALALLAQLGGVDAVITDLRMPNMDGFALSAYLAGHYPRIPRLIISGFDQDPDDVAALGPLLLKPFSAEQLVERLRQALLREAHRA